MYGIQVMFSLTTTSWLPIHV